MRALGSDATGNGGSKRSRRSPLPRDPPPDPPPFPAVDWNYDVFIVHTGPLKQLASDLNEELRRLGFTIFMLDSEGGYADARMLLSVGMSPIGLALINADFLEWRWPLRELESLVKAGSLLPVLIGMSITEFEQAWRASSAAAGLGEEMFESVMRTTFVVDQGGWRDQLRERICIAMLRRIVEEVCPRLPDGAASMRIVERALKAARLVAAHHFVDLRGRDIQAAAAWVTYLEDFREAGTARFRTGFDLLALEPQEVNVPIGMPESPVSQAARILVRCTMPGADGVADLSHLPDLPGLALDRWLEPKEMGALRSQLCAGLRSLKVDGIVAIAKLPNLVASFTHLSSISLLGTRLRKFPPELCQLTSLQSLAMGRQGPEVIPEMQGSLERLGAFQLLTELRLRDMGLTELSWSTSSDSSVAPPWPELRILQVDDNKLTELPSWLPLLTLLEELDVSGNELTRLPDFDPVRSRRTELVRISIELQRLGLHSDAGRLLETRGLQSLVPLRSLYVQRNLLTVLPLSLVDIRDTLTTLVANPQKDPSKPGERGGLRSLRLPPEEVLAKPIGTVLRFLEEMRDTGQQTRTMMKVSFVGEGGAGKTHLCLALQGKLDQYGYDDPETVGIETGAWVAKSEDKTKAPVFCRSWDFAGQASYRAVHQFFFTRGRSLYILVLDLTQVLHLHGQELRQAVMQRTAFWVESLLARAPGAVVKVVLSKADTLSAEECVELFGVRSIVQSCLDELVTGFLKALETERDMLKAVERGAGPAGESWETGRGSVRLMELDAAIASGGLKCPETDAEILPIGVPPRDSNDGSDGAGSGQKTRAEVASGSDQPDETLWDRVLIDVKGLEAEPSQPGGPLFPGQSASFALDSEQEDDGGELFATVGEVQAAIVDLAAMNGSFTVTFPASWVRLIEWVEGEREGGSKVGEHPTTGSIEWRAYAEELSGEGKMFSSERSLRDATEVLHDLGYLLYYSGDGELGKNVFMDPQKVINLLKVVVQHNFAEKIRYSARNNSVGKDVGGRGRFEELTGEFLRKGTLDHRMLPQMWPGIRDWGLCKALLELLEKFDLAYGSKESVPEENKWGSHGVPSRWPLTPTQSLAAMFPLFGAPIVSRRLHFDRLLPEGVFEQLLVRCLGLQALLLPQGRTALWRSREAFGSGACFDCQGGVCLLLLMTRELDDSGESGTGVEVGGGGERPGDIFVMSWDSRSGTLKGPRNESTRPLEAVGQALGALAPLLNTRFPGVRFEEEVICHEPVRREGWADDDLIGAVAGKQLEEDSKISFKEIVGSIRASTGWRSLQEEETRWWCGTCQEERDVSTFGGQRVGEFPGLPKGQDASPQTPTGVLAGPDAADAAGTPSSTSQQATESRLAPMTSDAARTLPPQPYETVDWPHDVFISHAGTLKPLALDLERDLRSLGFRAFVDKTALNPGDSADDRMRQSAGTTPIGLALLNEDFVARKWPLAELKLIVEAGTLLPVVVGMSHTEFEQAWRASPKAVGMGEGLFTGVTRTTFVVDEGGWQGALRERICFAVLRRFVEKVCPRLPNIMASMLHVKRALKAAKFVAAHRMSELKGPDYEAAAQWVEHLTGIKEIRVALNKAPPSAAYLGP